MSVAKEQREKLIWEFPNIGKKAPEQEEKAFAYCEGYKEFLNAAKDRARICARGGAPPERGWL